MICFFNKYKKSVQKHTDFFDNSLLSIVPDIPLVIRNKPHNNQLCTDLSRFISAYPVVSHFLRFAWQTTAILTLYTLPALSPPIVTVAFVLPFNVFLTHLPPL